MVTLNGDFCPDSLDALLEASLKLRTPFKLDGWRTVIRSIRTALQQEITRLKTFHRAIAASLRD